MQAGFHVIGDAAVGAVVAGFRLAEKVLGEQALGAVRHRLEHLEMITAEQAAELARFRVIASVQPVFDAAWGGRHGMYAQRLGPDRAAGLNPFAMLAAAGRDARVRLGRPGHPGRPVGRRARRGGPPHARARG